MTCRKGRTYFAAVALLAIASHVATDAGSDDGGATASAISFDAVVQDTATIPDFDGDGTIGFGDFLQFAAKFGLGQGDDGFDVRYDLNGNGEIGFSDFLLFAQDFGKAAPSPIVSIPDANLRAAIESALGKTGGAPITRAEMATLDVLEAYDADISDLSGLAFAANLTVLQLSGNNISDISLLSGLTHLKSLFLGDNNVTDLSALAGLTDLTSLDVQSNGISDISALSGLTELTFLKLGYNNRTLFDRNLSPIPENSGITDISALSALTNLTVLELQYNNIADVSALSDLSNLGHLILQVNPIGDISALSGMTNLGSLVFGANEITDVSALSGLTNLRWLVLEANSISDLSPLAGLSKIESLDLNRNDIKDVSPLIGLTALETLDLSYNKIADISALSGLANLQRLNLWLNRVAEISPLRGLTNLIELELRWNPLNDPSLNDHIPALQKGGVSVYFTVLTTGDFDIELVFADGFSEDDKDELRLVARRWMAIISKDLPDYTFAEAWSGACGDHSFEISAGDRIDDLRIYMTTFEGGPAVGWGGPKLLREGTRLPVLGCMAFDLERANLLITGLHEVGHVLGFGLDPWHDLGLLGDFSRDDASADTHFSGPLAVAAFNDAGGRDYAGKKVPVQQMDGTHWRDSVLHGELMGPHGGGNLSAITVQSLADLGYGTDVARADPYVLHQHESAGKIVGMTAPVGPAVVSNVILPGVYSTSGADGYGQGRIGGRFRSTVGDGGTGWLGSAQGMWDRGMNSGLADRRMMLGAGPGANAVPESACGAGLMNEPIYVGDPQGRVVRTINR